MPRARSIVVGTDGSQRAERAVDRAGEIANALGATVHIVSGYSEDSSPVIVAPRLVAPAEVHEEDVNRTHAQNYVDRAQRRLSHLGIESETHVWPAEPAEALLAIADERDAELIVIGNRGMTGARRVLGSVPNHVSHHARCDVLIVKTD
jgi:nucleotide-binding universal stress UspA family protein